MKLVFTSLQNGQLEHKEVELPDRLLDLQIELESGPIFQIGTDDNEQVLELREVTYRHLGIFPNSSNSMTIKGL